MSRDDGTLDCDPSWPPPQPAPATPVGCPHATLLADWSCRPGCRCATCVERRKERTDEYVEWAEEKRRLLIDIRRKYCSAGCCDMCTRMFEDAMLAVELVESRAKSAALGGLYDCVNMAIVSLGKYAYMAMTKTLFVFPDGARTTPSQKHHMQQRIKVHEFVWKAMSLPCEKERMEAMDRYPTSRERKPEKEEVQDKEEQEKQDDSIAFSLCPNRIAAFMRERAVRLSEQAMAMESPPFKELSVLAIKLRRYCDDNDTIDAFGEALQALATAIELQQLKPHACCA